MVKEGNVNNLLKEKTACVSSGALQPIAQGLSLAVPEHLTARLSRSSQNCCNSSKPCHELCSPLNPRGTYWQFL